MCSSPICHCRRSCSPQTLSPPCSIYYLVTGLFFLLLDVSYNFSYLVWCVCVTESFLLSAMSYDRFLAICKPLHYTLIMDPRLCLCLILVCWMLGFLIMTIALCVVNTLYFCRENIDHFYCDFIPILKLACSDTSMVEIVTCFLSSSATMFPFLVIIVTYGFIIRAIARISSSTGKEKAFSTCSSHLGVVFTYYTTMIVVYVVPPGHFLTANKIVSLLYTVITPLVNPFIYTLRNQEINAAVRQTLTSISRL
ncbi:unnamed protein product [Staurois parvus]|uniref:G-protein coupled receptors family 1 profile domain-containing protein n=1 Tax=Staurois parvus TaxID=386267 RepID=A0ABN9HR34_9NEOB|nr:unnamed protein product [Staurois parvus]